MAAKKDTAPAKAKKAPAKAAAPAKTAPVTAVHADPVGALEEVLAHLKKAGAGAGAKAEAALDEARIAIGKAADYLRQDAKKDTKLLLDKAVKEAKAHPKTTAAIAAAAVALAGVVVAGEVSKRKKAKKASEKAKK